VQLVSGTTEDGKMKARAVHSDGLELATESFGDPADPPVLLVMGAMASMLWWPAPFCEQLAARGRHVIRYDNRDTGLSTTYPPGEPPYTIADMAEDAIRVLDGYGITAAHLVGMSLGGMIAQRTALKHPDRVATLAAISTSPLGVDTSSLPQMSAAYSEHATEGEAVDWSDRSQVIDYMIKDSRMLAGTAYPHDPAAARALIERDVGRARNFASATNHFLLEGGDPWQGRLTTLDAPLLVIHGTADPIFPVEHGIALANAVPGASLLKLEGGGHELHPGHWDRMVGRITAHTGPGRTTGWRSGRFRRRRSAGAAPTGSAARPDR
jgi:pimeloyl-ACP methyl ester carboxylesterase